MLQEQNNLSRSPSGSTLLSPSMLHDNNNRKGNDYKAKKPSNAQKKKLSIAATTSDNIISKDKDKEAQQKRPPSKVTTIRLPRKSILPTEVPDPLETNQISSNPSQLKENTATTTTTITNNNNSVPTKWLGLIDYEPFALPFDLPKSVKELRSIIGSTIDIYISPSMLDSNHNPVISKCCIWGGKKKKSPFVKQKRLPTYTDDSDAVCILFHNIDRSLLMQGNDSYKLKFIINGQIRKYSSTKRNNISSRSWKNHSGLSIQLLSITGCNSIRLKEKKNISTTTTTDCSSSISFKGPNQEPMLPFKDLTVSSDILIKKIFLQNPLAILEILSNINEIHRIRRCYDGREEEEKEGLSLMIEKAPDSSRTKIQYRDLSFRKEGLIESKSGNLLLIGTHYRWVQLF